MQNTFSCFFLVQCICCNCNFDVYPISVPHFLNRCGYRGILFPIYSMDISTSTTYHSSLSSMYEKQRWHFLLSWKGSLYFNLFKNTSCQRGIHIFYHIFLHRHFPIFVLRRTWVKKLWLYFRFSCIDFLQSFHVDLCKTLSKTNRKRRERKHGN